MKCLKCFYHQFQIYKHKIPNKTIDFWLPSFFHFQLRWRSVTLNWYEFEKKLLFLNIFFFLVCFLCVFFCKFFDISMKDRVVFYLLFLGFYSRLYFFFKMFIKLFVSICDFMKCLYTILNCLSFLLFVFSYRFKFDERIFYKCCI